MKSYLFIPFLFFLLLSPFINLYAQETMQSDPTPQMEHSLPPGQHSASAEMSSSGHTESPYSPSTHESGDFTPKFLHMLFILTLLVAFMIVASLTLKRMTRARVSQMNDQSLIKIIEARTLSPKSTLYLLNIEGEEILIGESSAGLSHIATISRPYRLVEHTNAEDGS